MFCFQCQETAMNKGCTKVGICGKQPKTANLQDKLIYVTKLFAKVLKDARNNGTFIEEEYENQINTNLFITITNANFDNHKINDAITKTVNMINHFDPTINISLENMISILDQKDEDIRSLKELITYGLKGMAAYNKHANALGYRSKEINQFMQDTLALLLEDISAEKLIELLTLEGQMGVEVMALLDKANTNTYGNPEITKVNLGVRDRPGILVSGHDLKDLEMLLEQSKDAGVDIYTHSEMLPAHYYPFFKKYDHFIGNYGNAWWKQKEEFEAFNGPILLTTNCLVPPKESYKDRVYTTGAVGFEGCYHIDEKDDKAKDFSKIIEHAKLCKAPRQLETGTLTGGFGHHQVLALTDQIIEAVKTGKIKKFVVMAGCDGRQQSRSYYQDFAKKLPQDTVILTAGCAKYKYNKLDLGTIDGIPRVLDAGQCNDSYSLVVIALKLKEALGHGATHVVNSRTEDLVERVRELTEGYGPTAVIDAACFKGSFLTACRCAGNAGRVITMGFSVDPDDINQFVITSKELDVRGSRLQNRRFQTVIDLIDKGQVDLSGSISHRFYFQDAQKAFDFNDTHDPSIRKIVLTFDKQ